MSVELLLVSLISEPVPLITPESVWLALLEYCNVPLFAILALYGLPAPLANDPAPAICRVPALMVVVPWYELLAVSTAVPAPDLTSGEMFQSCALVVNVEPDAVSKVNV
ncbi:hypothetical protein ABIC63_002189 [Pseudacidovorax sp. 1753]